MLFTGCSYPSYTHILKILLKGISLHDYALFAVACDLNTRTVRITVGDLADRTMVDDSAFRLIINAILIAKYGTDVFKLRKEPITYVC